MKNQRQKSKKKTDLPTEGELGLQDSQGGCREEEEEEEVVRHGAASEHWLVKLGGQGE